MGGEAFTNSTPHPNPPPQGGREQDKQAWDDGRHTMKSVRIGNGCGFWGDNLDAPVLLAEQGGLD